MPFTISEKLQAIARKKGITAADIAAALNCSVQNVYKKLKRDKWNNEELTTWAALLGCSFDPVFTDTTTGEKF